MSRRHCCAALVFAALCWPTPAFSHQFFFATPENGGVIDALFGTNDAVIGFTKADPMNAETFIDPSPVTVNLTSQFSDPVGFPPVFLGFRGLTQVFKGSTLQINKDSAHFFVENVVLRDDAKFTMKGGFAVSLIDSRNTSEVDLSGGVVDAIFGGPVGGIAAGDDSHVKIEGTVQVQQPIIMSSRSVLNGLGGVVGGVTLKGGATANLSGTIFTGGLSVVAPDGGAATISGGSVDSVSVEAGSVAMNGGTIARGGVTVGSLDQGHSGTFEATGGSIGGDVTVTGGSCILGVSVLGNVTVDAAGGTHSHLDLISGNVTGSVTANNGATVGIGGVDTKISQDVSAVGGIVTLSDGSVRGDAIALNGTLNMLGGNVLGTVRAFGIKDDGTDDVTMAGGTANALSVLNGRATIEESKIKGDATVSDGKLHIFDSQIDGTLSTSGDNSLIGGGLEPNVTMTSGSLGGLSANGASIVNLSGPAKVIGNVVAHDNAHVSTIFDTSAIIGNVDAFDQSHIDLGGSTTVVGNMTAHDQAVVTYTLAGQIVVVPPAPPGGGSGAEEAIHALKSSLANGASTPPQFFLFDESTLIFNGLDFMAALMDGNVDGKFSEYGVAGHFADGTPFPEGLIVFVENGHELDPLGMPHFEFRFESVPEPGVLVLLTVGSAVLVAKHRRRPRGMKSAKNSC